MNSMHATCVALPEGAIALRGPSGCGKSDLALRLINDGATLIGDDYCRFEVEDGQLVVLPFPHTAGLLEVRGLGLLPVPYERRAALIAIIDLTPLHRIERLPVDEFESILGLSVRRFLLHPFETSAPQKARLAARVAIGVTVPVYKGHAEEKTAVPGASNVHIK